MGIRTLAAAFSAVLIFAGAAQAETAMSVYVAGHVDYTELDGSYSDDNSTSYGGSVAVAFPVSGNIGMQIDAAVTSFDDEISEDELYTGTVHLFHRDANALVGGFLGAATVDDATAYGGGVEAARYFETVTIGGQITYAELDDSDYSLWSVNAQATKFYGDNLAANLGFGFGRIDYSSSNADFWSLSGGAEYQFASAPVAVGVRVAYVDTEGDDNNATTIGLTGRYVFTGESLRQRDRTGASLPGIVTAASTSLF